MPATRTVEHEITVAAPPDHLYQLIADVENWPSLFAPTVHAEQLERGESHERIRLWATANGAAKTWTSRRELDPAARTVTFRQEVSQPPVGAMGGAWIIEPRPDGTSRVRLTHDYHAATDDPADLAWIDTAVDRNSRAELAALRDTAELDQGAPDLLLTFDDALEIDGKAADVYDFINDAHLWGERLPHVARVSLVEETPGLQLLEMDTRTADGSTHTTTSVRVCQPSERIVYKQVRVPALMTLHTGRWLLEDLPGGGVRATSRHTVRINESNIRAVLGPSAGLADARQYVRTALGTNSLATLRHAKSYAEGR
ncbi:Granaticin polyketide synthase bifunctional cyclase/dehydratase [Frankia canadensis]|uniref:Granaticin polyketide synthase bifunctional cyclase/dehydratase n=1 Tax=Frankia canadensis TaxID=1836972 RepID=A0A2I2KLH3_9ACTN|nr:aromatase/cyclase [Frankia canadensis]SNQ46497.1 Granaticin polyketide synthase bifunctional cyclase/dehydratase [Frankia canadensis]SOU53787.1 Granaticin polyketide synthase bifunctional cyclase/dehydratase [Frankia canadensis]